MARVSFSDIKFEDKGDFVRAGFLRMFYFDIRKEDLIRISGFKAKDGALEFEESDEKRVQKEFSRVLAKGFEGLRNRMNGKKTVYVHKNSGIPLVGSGAFGIIDRGTSLIEIKPITGCNLKCIYCSVDEDRRIVDFVVEKDYIAEELRKLVEFKGAKGIEAHINSQGEPLMYGPIVELIRDIKGIENVSTISIDTNGTLLTEKKVDEMADAGLTRFQLSINAMDEKVAARMAGATYDVERIKRLCVHIVKKCELMLTPVLVPGVNDGEIGRIIEFAKRTIKGQKSPILGIQNFLCYKFGRNPVKAMEMEEFNSRMRELEKEHKTKLVLGAEDFGIFKARELPKPFRKGEAVKAGIVCDGRMAGEKIAAAKGRAITVPNCRKEKGEIRLRITRTKHNIFMGEEV